jgi:hypothetical protein
MSGFSDGLDKVAVFGDASAVFRRPRELAIDADWILEIGRWKTNWSCVESGGLSYEPQRVSSIDGCHYGSDGVPRQLRP